MKNKNWTTLITILLMSLCVLGGAWWWDARNYPMPGIPEAPPSPFAYPNWDWDETVETNISRVQDRLRSRRYGRLKEKWIRELKLADSYWTFRSGKYTIHFGEDGNVRVRKSEESLSDELENFHSFERTRVKEITLYSERDGKGESTRVGISAINEYSIMLVESGNRSLAVIDLDTSSSYFDSLGN